MTKDRDQKLDDLLAKQELTDLIYTYCRAVDRMDQQLLRSLYHDDAQDDHGHFGSGPVENFLRFTAQHDHTKPFGVVHHNITNINLKVNGNYAEGESYVTAFHVIDSPDGAFDFVYIGRYLDKFERRNNEWRILHRRCVVDLCYQIPNSVMSLEGPMTSGFHHGKNGPHDPAYEFFKLFRRGER